MNTRARLALALLIFVVVVGGEWLSHLNYSLGVFYLFPIVVAATVCTRWQVLIAAVVCAYVRSLFTPDLHGVEFALRFTMAVLAYAGIGLLIVEMSRGRRAIQSAYAELQLEQQLRNAAERRLAMLVDSSPAGIVTLDHKGVVVAANSALHHMLGYEPGRLVGRNLNDQLPIYAGALAIGKTMRTATQTWARRVDGSSFPVATWFSTYDEAQAHYLAAILVDTSEEVRDREHESFRQITDAHRLFAGAVLHEIRNLCAAIRVVTSNLARREELRQNADFHSLASLVESLASIAAARLEDVRGERAAASVSLSTVLQHLRVVIENDWADAGATLEWDVHDANVHADPHALIQTFLNLTQNALRALQDRSEPRLRIVVKTERDGVSVRFTDNGPGVSDASTLFQPFRPGAQNVGLGLFIARTLVRSFDGDLVHVPTESGCCFEVRLRVLA